MGTDHLKKKTVEMSLGSHGVDDSMIGLAVDYADEHESSDSDLGTGSDSDLQQPTKEEDKQPAPRSVPQPAKPREAKHGQQPSSSDDFQFGMYHAHASQANVLRF